MGKNDKWYILAVILLALVAGSYFLSVVSFSTRPYEQIIGNTASGQDAQGVINVGPFTSGASQADDYYRIEKITLDGVDVVNYLTSTSPSSYQTNTAKISWGYDTFAGHNQCNIGAQPNYVCEVMQYSPNTAVPKVQILHFAIKTPALGTHTVTTVVCANTGYPSFVPTGEQCPTGGKDPFTQQYIYCKVLTDTFTVTSGTTSPPPTPPAITDFWNSIKSFIDGLIAWLRNLLPFAIATTSAPVNVPYSSTISLSSIPPTDTDGADGYVAETTCAGFIIDSSGAYKYQGTPTVLANGITTYSTTVSFTPTVTGKYAQGIACITRSASYNYATQTWNSWTTPTVSASDKGDITVTGPGTPPTPPAITDFWGSISALISGFMCWLTQLLGGTC